jgi:cysteine desulfurase
MNKIYLDNNATTTIDPRVLKAMLVEYSASPANASSVHYFGQQAKAWLMNARQTISSFFGVKPQELIFTSGGTESINLLIRGLFGYRPQGQLVTTSIEHAAVYRTVQSLETAGVEVAWLPVTAWGAPLPRDVEGAIQSNTKAIILSAANNETGVKIDMEAIAAIAQRHGIPLIIDAITLIGKEEPVIPNGVSAIAFSGHKFHAPKGIGGAIIRSGLKLFPELTGGAQEYMRRAGTENLAGILGLAEAFEILRENQDAITRHLFCLREHFEKNLFSQIADVSVNGTGPRIANTSNISFEGVDAETLLVHLDMEGVAASHGSACSSGALEPSRVLLQMGLDRTTARSSVRFSFSRMNTIEEINTCIEHLVGIVQKLRIC